MKNPFRKSTDEPTIKPAATTDTAQPTINTSAVEMRDQVFAALAPRVGPDGAKILREDFEEHLAADPVNGAEAGWMCLVGKLIDTIDRFNDMYDGKPTTAAALTDTAASGVSPFTVYRKYDE